MPPLFLIPGWNTSPAIWDPLVSALAGRLEVVRALPPGDGGPLPATDAPETPTESRLAAWLEILWRQAPPAAHWCGWSWGATLALSAAITAPERIARLSLISPTPRFAAGQDWPWGAEPRTFAALLQRIGRDRDAGWKRFLNWQLERPPTEEEWAALRRCQSTAPLPVLQQSQQLLLDIDLRQRLREISIPVHIWAASQDRIIPPEASQEVARQIPGARFQTLGTNHLVPWFEADELARGLLESEEVQP